MILSTKESLLKIRMASVRHLVFVCKANSSRSGYYENIKFYF